MKEEFEDRLKKYRELLKSLSGPSIKSSSARSLTTDVARRKKSQPAVPRIKAPSKPEPSLEVSGISLLQRRGRIASRASDASIPTLQPLARSKAASSRRKLISETISLQEELKTPRGERPVAQKPLEISPLVVEELVNATCQTDQLSKPSFKFWIPPQISLVASEEEAIVEPLPEPPKPQTEDTTDVLEEEIVRERTLLQKELLNLLSN
jgi:hypothetical protein